MRKLLVFIILLHKKDTGSCSKNDLFSDSFKNELILSIYYINIQIWIEPYTLKTTRTITTAPSSIHTTQESPNPKNTKTTGSPNKEHTPDQYSQAGDSP